jgi:hypothetical protein
VEKKGGVEAGKKGIKIDEGRKGRGVNLEYY